MEINLIVITNKQIILSDLIIIQII